MLCSSNFYRIEEMLDVVKRSLDYMLLLESETDLASSVEYIDVVVLTL